MLVQKGQNIKMHIHTSRYIYVYQVSFITVKISYIHQEVNLSTTRFKYTYQDLHTRIKIRKYLSSSAYVDQDLHIPRLLHVYIKIHMYIEIMRGFHEVLSQMV